MLGTSGQLGILAFAITFGAGISWFRAVRQVRIPENRTLFLLVWLFAAVLGAMSLSNGPGWLGGSAASLAILGGLFFLFTVSISKQAVGYDAIAVGTTIPEFRALDENGNLFESSSLAGNVLLVKFFRGHW